MKKFLVNLFCSFIPLKAKRDAIRNKYFPKKIAPDIWQTMNMNNHIEIAEEDKAHVSLSIQGVNNTVIIKKLCMGFSGHICISLAGNNCNIVLDEGIWVSQLLHIVAGQIHPNFGMIENTQIAIGKQTSFESCNITTFNSNAKLNIGERCMFAYGIDVFHTDAHPIYNLSKTQILNKVKTMHIGNHVWVGAKSVILKNTTIPDECIVGFGSIVSSKSCPSGSKHYIVAGNPARVVREGITWDSNGSDGYVQNLKN